MRRPLVLLAIIAALSLGAWLYLSATRTPSGRPRVDAPAGAIENDPRVARDANADEAVALRASIVGEWRSLDDAKFTRELRADGTYVDAYAGAADAQGSWALADDGTRELRLSLAEEELRFAVDEATADRLTLTYLGRGTALRFERVR